jgi:hypothetical protein
MKRFFISLLSLILGAIVGVAQTKNEFYCGVNDKNLPDDIIQYMGRAKLLLVKQRARGSASPRNTCRLAVEIDSDTYLEFDKDTNRIRDLVLQQIESVSQTFEKEINTQLVVVNIHIWKDNEPDPYKGVPNIFIAMDKLKERDKFLKGIGYDKIIYLFTKVSISGGLGNLPGPASVSPLNSQETIMHELGHNFGSPHTHSCAWPGGPIDYCSTFDSTCYVGSIEDTKGTVMSYCGIRQSSFHPLCRSVMIEHAENNFEKIVSSPSNSPKLSQQVEIIGSRFLYWNGEPTSEYYNIEISDTNNFERIILKDSTFINGYEINSLSTNQPYFVRLRSVNTLGKSPWSTIYRIKILENSENIGIPILTSPAEEQRFVTAINGNYFFSAKPVKGATSYEIQIANKNDPTFRYKLNSSTSMIPQFNISFSALGSTIWRVRALNGNRKGVWSTVGSFVPDKSLAYLTLPFFQNGLAPLTFPYAYRPIDGGLTVQITVAKDESFTQIVYQKEHKEFIENQKDYITGVIYNLQPSSQYFIKFEELNDNTNKSQLNGTLVKKVLKFNTGTTVVSSRWSFFNASTISNFPYGNLENLVLKNNEAWFTHKISGLLRIKQDSLSLKTIDRLTTKGKIGGRGMVICKDKYDNIWLTNAISVGSFNTNYIESPKYQFGKLSNTEDDLTNRIEYNHDSNFFSKLGVEPLIFFGYNKIFTLKANNDLDKIYDLPFSYSVSRSIATSNSIWMLQNNNSDNSNRIVEFDISSKRWRFFSFENTPYLGRKIHDMCIDSNGNTWVIHSKDNNSLFILSKFDGQSWSNHSRFGNPSFFPVNVVSDLFGNIYVVENTRIIQRYDGQAWKKIVDLPYTNLGEMQIDDRGNFWFNSYTLQLIRYNPCNSVAAPKLTMNKQNLEIGESAVLSAEGCTSTVWSWSNTDESINDKLLKGTNQLAITPTATTIYRARCYDDGCSGTESQLTVSVLPKINLQKINKSTYCPGDVLTATIALQGKVETANQYTLVVKSGSQLTRYVATGAGLELSVTLPTTMPPSQYVVYAESSLPVVRSRDSLQFSVVSLPTAELSVSKNSMLPGDSTQVSVALTGTSPWRFTRWDGVASLAIASPYVSTFRSDLKPTDYNLTITALRDAVCSTGTVKNSLPIKVIVLAIDPSTSNKVLVFPNPTSGRLRIKTEAPYAIEALELIDTQGRAIQRSLHYDATFQQEIDFTTLPANTYFLKVTSYSGKVFTYKIIVTR